MQLTSREYNLRNNELWSFIENTFDFVICFNLKTDNVIRKSGFDKACLTIDSFEKYSPLIEEYCGAYIHEDYREEFALKSSVEYISKHGKIVFSCLEIVEGGRPNWYEYSIIREGDVVTYLIRDVNEIKSRELKLLHKSSIDQQTGALTRHTFDSHVDGLLLNMDNKFAILFVDIDDFKAINDTYGHATGDDVINNVVNLLKESFRKDDKVGRYGGDEFVVCMHDATTDEVVKKLEALYDRLSHVQPEEDYTVSFSIGVGFHPMDGVNRREIYNAADKALYAVKNSRKGRYLCKDFSHFKKHSMDSTNPKVTMN